MQNTFEEIRKQIHDIRSFLGPFDMKMASLDHRITELRVFLDDKFVEYESRLTGTAFKVEDLWDRVGWIEEILKIPSRPARKSPPPSPPQRPEA